MSKVADIQHFLSRFRENYASVDLTRIGGHGDGGYLLPDNLDEVKYCFSPGVATTANFEQQLSQQYGIKSFMADASVSKSPVSDENFHFIPKFLGSRTHENMVTLSDWMDSCIGNDQAPKILQMDIEGGEYDVLIYESPETLAKFTTMIIEFHWVDMIFERNFVRMFSSVFEKIFLNFSIAHVHPNNCCGTAVQNGLEIPRVFEVTFIRNDLLERFRNKSKVKLPHPLDSRNVPSNPDIAMPAVWWKHDGG